MKLARIEQEIIEHLKQLSHLADLFENLEQDIKPEYKAHLSYYVTLLRKEIRRIEDILRDLGDLL